MAAIIMNAGDIYGDSRRPVYRDKEIAKMNALGLEAEELNLRKLFDKAGELRAELRKRAAVHEESADEDPVPGFGMQRAVPNTVGTDAFDVSMQPQQSLSLFAAILVGAGELDLFGRRTAQCTTNRVIADTARCFECS